MSRLLLSILLLASLLGGLAGAPALHADDGPLVSSQASSSTGAPMTAMDCGDCAVTGACIAPILAPTAGLAGRWLPPAQLSPHLFGQVRPPETAPPKAFSV